MNWQKWDDEKMKPQRLGNVSIPDEELIKDKKLNEKIEQIDKYIRRLRA